MSAEVVLTDATFEEAAGSGVALVDFWAPWCGPCQMQGPIIEQVAESFAGRVTVGKMEVDGNPRTAARFGVQSIPTLILFKDGEEAQRFVGVQNAATLTEALDAALA